MSRTILRFSAALLLLVCGGAQSATVAGRILDAGTLAPVDGATVIFSLWGFIPNEIARLETGPDGRFEFDFDGSALYGISASRTGYLSATRTITLTAGVSINDADVLLNRPASVRLRLLDAENDAPIAGTRAFLTRFGSGGTGPTSNDLGEILWQSLQAGEYRLCVTDPTDDYRDQCWPDLLLPIDADPTGAQSFMLASGESLEVTMRLIRGARVSGTVSSSVPSVDVRNRILQLNVIDSAGRTGSAEAAIDGSGLYQIGGLPDGDYRLILGGSELYPVAGASMWWSRVLYPAIPCDAGCDPMQGTVVSTSLLAEATQINFLATPGAVIRGQVRSAVDNMPLSGVQIQQFVLPFPILPSLSRTTFTDSEGRYELAGINPNQVNTLAAVNDLGYLNVKWPDETCISSCGTGSPLQLSSGVQAQPHDFLLQPGTVLAGRSYRESDDSPVIADIYIHDMAGNQVGTRRTADDGTFALPALATGQYFLMANMVWAVPPMCVDHTGALCTLGALPPMPSFIEISQPGQIDGLEFSFPIDVFGDGFE
ncbi:MAG: carboxypeptidase regulatory-like domain-containing protein [Lysobacterales bacterium]